MSEAIKATIGQHRGRLYVYLLKRTCGTPFYVGMGKGLRVLRHERLARETDEQSHRLNVIRKIWRDGGEVGKEIESWHDTPEAAGEREAALIAQIGRLDLGTGPLVNQTSGGVGGWMMGPDVRQRVSQQVSARFASTEERERQSRRISDYYAAHPEAIAEQKGRQRQAMASSEARDRIGQARRRFNEQHPEIAEEYRRERVATLQSERHRAACSEKMKRRLEENPGCLDRLNEAAKRPEARAAHAESQRRRFADPNERARMSKLTRDGRKRRDDTRARALRLLASLGLVPPSGKASLQAWVDFEARLLPIASQQGVPHENDEDRA